MNSISLNYTGTDPSQFPIELIFTANQIYKAIERIAKYSAGILILIPLILTLLVAIPILYIIIGVIFTYYMISIHYRIKKELKKRISDNEYEVYYHTYLSMKKSAQNLNRILNVGKQGGKGWFLKPILFYIKNFSQDTNRLLKHFESQLFEDQKETGISDDDIKFLQKQLEGFEHDWDDDEKWADFQIAHHHHLTV